MADIATIFHWPPSVTDVGAADRSAGTWRYKAIQRSGANDE
ncbi:GpE family phage tail protein [Klebsiella pneumoniae]|nr:GpE family phage tail protein [Klebsiella pneumoniae]